MLAIVAGPGGEKSPRVLLAERFPQKAALIVSLPLYVDPKMAEGDIKLTWFGEKVRP